MPLAWLSAGFQPLPPLPTSKLGPSGADSRVGGFVYILGPCGSPTNSPVRLGVSLAASNPTSFFSQGIWGFIAPCWNPGLHSLSRSPVVPPGLSAHKCGTAHSASCCPPQSSSHCLTASPLHPSCSSPPLLLVLRNVSSFSPWLLDFHTVQFSGSSGYFFYLIFVLVVQGGTVYLPMPPSWPGIRLHKPPNRLQATRV